MGPEYASPPPQTQPPAQPQPPTAAPPSYPPAAPPPPPPPRRLMRSSRERMWAGVAGGMAEYFDLDPNLVRLLWVAAAVVSLPAGGLAVPVYILAWILLPRDDRPPVNTPHGGWRDWSDEFHSETQRLADEARRMADDVRHTPKTTGEQTVNANTNAPQAEQDWWRSERYVERHRHHGRHPRSTGIVLVTLGVLLLAANNGLFGMIDPRTMWPVVFIGLGVILLARQTGWGR